jgi:hypothetical protein
MVDAGRQLAWSAVASDFRVPQTSQNAKVIDAVKMPATFARTEELLFANMLHA